MKLSIIATLLFTLQVSGSVYSQTKRFDLSMKDVSVKEVLKTIETQSDFRFFYNDELSDINRLVSLNLQNQKVEEVLTHLFDNTRVTYKVLSNNLIVITPTGLIAQEQKVSGTVTDASSGEPLPGVNIMIEGSSIGTVTDVNGKYSISIPSPNAVIVFSFVGYNTEKTMANNRTVIDMTLIPDVKKLEEVVVIGYGTREKKDVTTSIATVSSKDISNSSSISPELAMQGKTAGVFVESGGGNPNSRPTIRVRGTNTWGVADPLYVIDGVPITEFGSGAESSTGAGTNSNSANLSQDIRGSVNIMSMINPSDIESISVLKDASAAAIYGVRASNGVILITTKKGKSGKPKVDFSLKTGVQNIPKKYDMLNTKDYTALYWESFHNNPAELVNMPTVFDPSSPDYLGNSKTYDWLTPLYNKNAQIKDYSVRVSGGNDYTSYYVSGGYSKSEAPLIKNNLERYSLATNVTTKINKYLSTGITYRFTHQDTEDATPNSLNYVSGTPPWQPIYAVDGKGGGYNEFEPAVDLYDGTGAFNPVKRYGTETHMNPFGQASSADNNYVNVRNLGNAFVEVEPVKGLKFKGNVSFDWYNYSQKNWSLYENQIFNITPTDTRTLGDGHSYGTVGSRNSTNINIVKEFSITYNKTFGLHNIDLLFNAMDQKYTYDFYGGSSEQLSTSDPNQRLVEAGQRGYSNMGEIKSQMVLQGYLGRLSYNYNSKYYLDAVIRRDGSARFAPGKKWGTFPALSAAWRISGEDFLKDVSFVNDIKLRAGWGQMGNQETRSFSYLATLSRAPHTSFGIDPANPGRGLVYWGIVSGDFPNPDLSWESTTTTNIGIDGILFKNVTFTVEYFHKVTDGLIQDSKLPASVGSENNPIINVGKVQNTGLEFSLGYHGKVGDLGYGVNANLSTLKNKVVKTYDDAPIGGEWGGRIEEGKPINSLWGYKKGGIFQSDAEVADYQAKTKDKIASSQHPGDMWFQDINGNPDVNNRFYKPGADSVVNDYDRTYLGKTIPGYYYGLNFNLEYKGFDLSCYFTGVGDVMKISARRDMETMSSKGVNQSTSVLGRWTTTNPSTTMPRAAASDPASNNRFSDRWIESAAYFRLSNLQLGYTLPKMNTQIFDRARIWVGGSNLFTKTKWTGLDPENEASPIPRVFSLGIDATF